MQKRNLGENPSDLSGGVVTLPLLQRLRELHAESAAPEVTIEMIDNFCRNPSGKVINNVRYSVETYNSLPKLLDALEKAMESLEELSRLGNGERLGNSIGNVKAQKALSDITQILQ